MQHILCHYGEIALKKNNRNWFEQALIKNIERQLKDYAPLKAHKLAGRVWIEFAEPHRREAVQPLLKKIFGVVNFIPCERVEAGLDKLKAGVLTALGDYKFDSFAVRAKKCEPQLALGSQEVNEAIGRLVQEKTGSRVDLENPQTTIHIEMFHDRFFFGFEKIAGPGGLPVGVAGSVAGLLSGGIDSPVACLRMMKRGCRVLFVHFHSAPFASEQSLDKTLDLAEYLGSFQGGGLLLAVPFGEIQREIVAKAPEGYRVLLYRRMMLRIAEVLAREYGSMGLVTGESLSQVASQTLSNLASIEQAATLPIFRPLIGMDKVEIVKEAQAFGTYETSIRPHEDCCSFMVPRHPKTQSRAEELERLEANLPVDAWVERGVKETKRHVLQGG
ncbi:MAG: tRNA 4-thiouridine(8) synthase ThiI [Deltaproteobacteria bacterium]|nr:tRNA 4-thiouridine(8) synthase ThiI [Deltaproteobacteria bacterium]